MRIWGRRLAAVLAVAAAVGLLWYVLRPTPVRVELARVTRGPLRVTVDEEGYTRVRNRFVVTAPISGRVARIALDAGDPVERGSIVARMSPLPLDRRTVAEATAQLAAAEAQQRAAAAQVERAQATFAQAQRSAERARQLGRAGTIAVEERERAELEETARGRELEEATFTARAAAFDVVTARAALLAPGNESGQELLAACEAENGACIDLDSPASGRVLRIPEKSERVVTAGTPLLEIGDPHELEIVVDVLSADAVRVTPGAPIVLENWGGTEPLQAKVRLVEPSGFVKLSALGVEEQRVNVVGDFVGPPSALADGYRVDARIVVWESDDVLKVPTTALFRSGGAWSVFVVADGVASLQAIELGERGGAEAQVLKGLEPGAQVIVHPSDQVDDGVRVLAPATPIP